MISTTKNKLDNKEKKDIRVYRNLIIVAIMALVFSFVGSFLSVKNHDKKLMSDLEEEQRRDQEAMLGKTEDAEELEEDVEEDENKDKVETEEVGSLNKDLFFNGKEEDLNSIIDNGKSTLLAFGTKTCVYCEELKPILSELKDEYGDKLDILYIDIDKNGEIAEKYPIQLTPSTVLIGKDGGPLPVDEEMFVKYGIDGFSRSPDEPLEVSAFFGLKQKDSLKEIIDDLLL